MSSTLRRPRHRPQWAPPGGPPSWLLPPGAYNRPALTSRPRRFGWRPRWWRSFFWRERPGRHRLVPPPAVMDDEDLDDPLIAATPVEADEL